MSEINTHEHRLTLAEVLEWMVADGLVPREVAEALLVLGLIVFTIVTFTLEWVRADIVAPLVLVVLGVANLVPVEQLFDGFAGDAVIAILATMILGAGLDRTGVLAYAASFILRLSAGVERRLLLVLCGLTGSLSSPRRR